MALNSIANIKRGILREPSSTIMSRMLETVSIFSGLDSQQLAEIEKYAVIRNYPKKTIVICEGGDNSDSLYVILSGKVKVYLSDEDGKEAIVNYQGAGEYFGELSLIDEYERSASVVTVEKSSFAVIYKQAFADLLRNNPDISVQLIKDLAHRVRVLTSDVKTLALSDVYGRLCKLLISLATERDGRLMVENTPTQQDIANRIGASREMVCRILKDLGTGGYISQEHKYLVINKQLPQHY